MADRVQSTADYVRILLNVCLILLGLLVALGILTLPPLDFWLAVILTVAGIAIVSVPNVFTRFIGFIVLLVGFYLVLRSLDVISIPYLQYGLGGLLILVGAVNLVRGAKGGSVHQNQTPVNN